MSYPSFFSFFGTSLLFHTLKFDYKYIIWNLQEIIITNTIKLNYKIYIFKIISFETFIFKNQKTIYKNLSIGHIEFWKANYTYIPFILKSIKFGKKFREKYIRLIFYFH